MDNFSFPFPSITHALNLKVIEQIFQSPSNLKPMFQLFLSWNIYINYGWLVMNTIRAPFQGRVFFFFCGRRKSESCETRDSGMSFIIDPVSLIPLKSRNIASLSHLCLPNLWSSEKKQGSPCPSLKDYAPTGLIIIIAAFFLPLSLGCPSFPLGNV